MKNTITCNLCGGGRFSERTPFKGTSRRYVYDFIYGRCENCKSIMRLTDISVDYSGYITSKNLQTVKAKRLIKFFSLLNVSMDDSILDYGCGNGSFLLTLKDLGFRNVKGYEPFNDEYNALEPGVKYTLIYLIHVFEHLADFNVFFSDIKRYSIENGKVLIITPSSSRITKLDPEDPFQQFAIHAPYHNFIPSDEIVMKLFSDNNFRLKVHMDYDVARSGLFANNNFSALMQHHLGGAKEDLLTSPKGKIAGTVLAHAPSVLNTFLFKTRDRLVSTFLFEKK